MDLIPSPLQSEGPPLCRRCDRRHGDSEPEKLACALRFYVLDNALPDALTAKIDAVADEIEEHATDMATAAHQEWLESGGGRY